jgi:hypothetical protein
MRFCDFTRAILPIDSKLSAELMARKPRDMLRSLTLKNLFDPLTWRIFTKLWAVVIYQMKRIEQLKREFLSINNFDIEKQFFAMDILRKKHIAFSDVSTIVK